MLPEAPSAAPAGALRAWKADPSGVAGGVVRTADEVVVTDTPFDDRGADLRPNSDPTDVVNGSDACGTPVPCFGQGANTKEGYVPGSGGPEGDYRYPDDLVLARNAADIVEARFAADRDAWYVLVRLNTLVDPGRTGVLVRVDGRELVVHGSSAKLDGVPVKAVANAKQALLEVRVPRSVHDLRGPRSVFVAAGLWDSKAGDWVRPAGSTPPWFDLLHVPSEPMTSYWRDLVQSEHIATGRFADDVVHVDWDALATSTCPTASCPSYEGPTRGLFSRTFRSGQDLGHGVTGHPRYGNSYDLYRAPVQPYSVYVPERPTGAMVLLLHYRSGNYMSYPITSMPGLSEWAEKLGVTVVMPHARGESSWYELEAEKDVFEAWRDAARHHAIDRERVYLAGMSMGGFGTWRLSHLYPDQFARGFVWAGLTSFGRTDVQPLWGNARNVPLHVVHGGLDPLVPVTGPERYMPEYGQRGGGTYRYQLYPDRNHETTFPGTTGQHLTAWLKGLPARKRNPVRVSYTTVRALQDAKQGHAYDGAYWVDRMVLAPGVDRGRVDASRTASPDAVTPFAAQVGADRLGPYRLTGADVTPAAAQRGLVDLRLTGLAGLELDTARMGWSDGRRRVTGTTDQAVEVLLVGVSAGSVRVTGATAAADRRGLRLRLTAGEIDVVLEPRRPIGSR